MKQPAKLKDIAKAANVSEMTASRALRKQSNVTAKTREKIEAIALEMGYIPNKIAGGLASNKVDLVGVIIPSVKSYVFSEVLDGISTTLNKTNLRAVFGLTDYDLTVEENVISEMLSWRPSGLIIAGLEHTETARQILSNTDVPVVEIMDVDGDPVDACVGISHFQAGYDMAAAIVKRGYKSIGFLGTKMTSDFRAGKRLNGFTQCLKENGLAFVGQEQYTSGSSIENGKLFTQKLLKQYPQIDCIYCSTDITAMGVEMYCLENNISIPEDLAIAGFNNLTIAHGLPKRIATTDSMRFEIGKQAAEIITNRNNGIKSADGNTTKLTAKIELGGSI